ncbi:MAG: SBBP repeat-containing protein, partial [Anaerolineae bacterium]|nr:SBBP repeat-containing protein [Anaerolineae bacterium]
VGQFAEDARFQVRGGNGTLWLTDDALWITVVERSAISDQRSARSGLSPAFPFDRDPESEIENRRGVNLRLSFPNANPHPRLEPFDRLETTVSYFLGNDPDGWRPAVPVWGGVRYVDLYPGIDLEVTSEGGQFVQRLHVQPGADLSQVKVRVEGAEAVELAGTESLRLSTAVGDYILPLLTVADTTLDAHPAVSAVKVTTFDIAAPLILSPRHLAAPSSAFQNQDSSSHLLYGTFLGGSGSDFGGGIAVDGAGAAYVTGVTWSSDFPTTPGAFDTDYNGDYDAFVVKVARDGSDLAYTAFLGGSRYDKGYGIAVNGSGEAYVVGETRSANFSTTPSAFDTTYNGEYDAFVVKVASDGSVLAYSTFLGASYDDYGYGIAVDSSGAAYVTGQTFPSNFPTTPGAFDTTPDNSRDSYVVKLAPDGSTLAYSTFLGGSNKDYGYGIAVDGKGAAYITGETWSSDFPTTLGAFDTTYNGGYYDAYVVKVAPDGSALAYAAFLGGSHDDVGMGIAVDGNGAAYVTGNTPSFDFPTTPGTFDATYNGRLDAFVVKVVPDGSTLAYSTFLGGSSNYDVGRSIAVAGSGAAYVTGWTGSSDFPTIPDAFTATHNGGMDAFVVKVSPDGNALVYSTFLGGHYGDYGYDIAVDRNGAVYVTGYTSSSDFPTTSDAFDIGYNGDGDAFMVKLDVGGTSPEPVSLTLSLEDWIHPAANLRVGVWLHSEAPEPITYTVRATLSQAGQAVDVLENPLIASVSNAPYHSFDFGLRDAGPYEVLVEALRDDSVLASAIGHTKVLSSTDAAQALTAAAELTRAAHWEFSEGQESVVWAYGESVPGLVAEAVDFLMGKLLGLIPWVGDAVGASAEELTEVLYEINSKLQNLEGFIEAASRPDVEYRAHQATDAHLSFERRDVNANRQQYDDFVMSHTIVWSPDHTRLTSEYWNIISTRVEEERSFGVAAPASLFMQLSLKERETALLVHKGIGAIFGTLAVLACLAVMFVVIVKALAVTWGTAIPGIIKSLAALKPMLSGLKSITAILLVLLAIEMDLQLDMTVAPAITKRHQEALTELRSLDQYSGQQGGGELELQVQIAGNSVTLSTFLTAENLPADTRLQTKLYSADGRLLQLQTYSPAMATGARDMTAQLPAGTYRAVTSAPVIGDWGNSAQVSTFEVAAPQVALDLALVASRLEISQTLQANLWVTNTDTLTGTGSLALLVEASDGDNGDAWLVDLDAGAQQQFELAFVPPAAGSYVLRARLFGADGALLALRETGYVVGDGPALAIEPDTAATWNPGESVTVQVALSNAGNESASGVLDIVTLDRESHQALYTTTLTIDLLPDATETYTVTALTDAQPGRYSINLLLDDEGYMSLPFVVAAENTLLVIAEPEPRYQLVGQEVAIAIEVVDMIYTHTDATMAGYVLDPLFASHPLSISHNGEGLYSVSYTPDLSGTYEVFITATREHWRSATTSANFIAQQASYLAATVSGNPQVSQLRPVTLTVHNEHSLPVIDALVTVSGTQEYVTRVTNAAGEALFPLMPSNGAPYEVKI